MPGLNLRGSGLGGGRTVITSLRIRSLVFAILLFAGALLGGVVGGVVALGLRPAPSVAPAAVATAAPATAAADDQRLREALPQVLQTVVTIVADLPTRRNEQGQLIEGTNLGSGIVVSDSGFVVTNYHVVDGARSIRVVLSTGEERDATLVADDSPFHDLAVLKTAAGGLRTARWGDSSMLRPGDLVAAISSGLVTYENQVKVGVVSAVGVPFPRDGVVLEDMIQTDAAVNHGDSGGALVNARGEVVGLLTTVVRSTPQGYTVEGVAMAHSSNSIRPVVESVLSTGANPRPRLGIERAGSHHIAIDDEVAASFGLPVRNGAAIIAVDPGSPAAEAGLRPGDIVLGVNGVAINYDFPFVNLVGSATGSAVTLVVLRDGQQHVINVTPRAVGPAGRPSG